MRIEYETEIIQVFSIKVEIGITPCPLDGSIGPRKVGSVACIACNHHLSMEPQNRIVNCKKEEKDVKSHMGSSKCT